MTDAADFDLPSLWEQIVGIAYRYLSELARSSDLIDYGELCEMLNLKTGIPFEPRESLLSSVLAAVGRQSFDDTGSVVTAVVVRRSSRTPGSGFFQLCEEVHLLPQGQSENPPASFWPQQLEATQRAFSIEISDADDPTIPTIKLYGDRSDQQGPFAWSGSAHMITLRNMAFMASASAMQPLPAVPCIGKCHCYGRLYLVAQPPQAVGGNTTSILQVQCATYPTSHFWDVL
jgi:hypothetical protein